MEHYELAICLLLLLSLAVFTSTIVCFAAAQIYTVNILRVPQYNQNCVRFLPQFSESANVDNVNSYLNFIK